MTMASFSRNLLWPAEKQIEVAKLESDALSGLPHELIVASDVLGIYPGVSGGHQQPRLAFAHLDHVRTQRVRYGCPDFELR